LTYFSKSKINEKKDFYGENSFVDEEAILTNHLGITGKKIGLGLFNKSKLSSVSLSNKRQPQI